ncbi:pseudouridine synthase [Psychromicrobium xiongbiense]|uniref:pseudouridine synthase n=1 Tax=Psychromicrobium xiongbiense TaxID=3051184 RepID=UPI0025567646|nr:pseudouridine synthase [Psychromicrobium sp. YIM S02556]
MSPRSGSEGHQGRSHSNRSSGRPGQSRAGQPKAGAGKSGFGKAGSGRPGAAKRDTARKPRPQGKQQSQSQPFGRERFGANLGPVSRRDDASKVQTQAQMNDMHDPEGVRLQKLLAAAGVASRRVCEEMIAEGRVEVDGQIVTELGLRVDPKTVTVSVDGIRVQLKDNMIYLAFNKPRGVVSTMSDPEGRKNISDFLKNKYAHERLFHVGRLDANTEGLLLLTNDGELANRLTHPRYAVPKTYLVQTRGPMEPGIGKAMRAGIELEDGVTSVDSFRLVDSTPGHVLVEVVLHSGKNRIVRRLFDAVGYPVERLVRLQMGPIRLGDIKQGAIRPLSNHEVGHLLAEVGL